MSKQDLVFFLTITMAQLSYPFLQDLLFLDPCLYSAQLLQDEP